MEATTYPAKGISLGTLGENTQVRRWGRTHRDRSGTILLLVPFGMSRRRSRKFTPLSLHFDRPSTRSTKTIRPRSLRVIVNRRWSLGIGRVGCGVVLTEGSGDGHLLNSVEDVVRLCCAVPVPVPVLSMSASTTLAASRSQRQDSPPSSPLIRGSNH